MMRQKTPVPARIVVGAFIAVILWIAAAMPGYSQATGSFKFDNWRGPAISVYFVEPEGLAADAPIVFVMHGVQRNADDYRDNWIRLAKEYGFAVYAPEFDLKNFPGAENYNQGAIGTGRVSSFDAIEPLFDAIRERRQTNQKSYVIFGHSAGAQFVHRFVFFAKGARFSLAMAANAGWYTMPTFEIEWPYGLGGIPRDDVNLEDAFSKPLLIMLGDKDTDPNAPNLRKSRQANKQGRNRLARGETFLNTAITTAGEANATLNWRYTIVKGVAHDNAKMARSAARVIATHREQKLGPKN